MTLEGDTEIVADANAYQLEGPFTTFFVADGGHGKISGWSVRVASLRTDRIASIRRHNSDLGVDGVPRNTPAANDLANHPVGQAGHDVVSLRAV